MVISASVLKPARTAKRFEPLRDLLGHAAVGELLADLQPDLQGIAPAVLGDGQAELHAEVQQPGLEYVAGGILQALGLLAGQVLVQFREDGDALVDLVAGDGLVPLGQQFLLVGLAPGGQVLGQAEHPLVPREQLDQPLDLHAGPVPVPLAEDLVDVPDGLGDLLLDGHHAGAGQFLPEVVRPPACSRTAAPSR